MSKPPNALPDRRLRRRFARDPKVLDPRPEALEELGSFRRSELEALRRRLAIASRPPSGAWFKAASQLFFGAALGAMLTPQPPWSLIGAFAALGLALALAWNAVAQQRAETVRAITDELDAILERYNPYS